MVVQAKNTFVVFVTARLSRSRQPSPLGERSLSCDHDSCPENTDRRSRPCERGQHPAKRASNRPAPIYPGEPGLRSPIYGLGA